MSELNVEELSELICSQRSGIYHLDIRPAGLAIIAPEGGVQFLLPDGRQAVLWPQANTVQL